MLFNTAIDLPSGIKSQQAHDVILTSMGCDDVALTSVQHHFNMMYLLGYCSKLTTARIS